MKKNYKAPEIGITIFGKENDVMTASGNGFIDKIPTSRQNGTNG